MRIATRVALAAACAAGLSGPGATAASAGEHERIVTNGGIVLFDHTGPLHRQLSIPENTAVTLYMCYVDDGRTTQCSKGQFAVS